MNSKQKFVFLLGVVVIATMGLYPPWKEAGPTGLPVQYAPVFAPPTPLDASKGLEIDLKRLLLQVGVAAILAGGLVAAAAPNPTSSASGSSAPNAPTAPVEIIPPPKTQTQFDPAKLGEADEDEEEEDDEYEDEEDDEDVEVEDGPNIIRLPAGKTYGEFLVESDDDPEYWETLSAARGVVKLPVGKRVQLEVKRGKEVDLSFVSMSPQASLYSVDLSNSAVRDWEVAHLQRLTELRELDLSHTKVSSSVVGYLKGLDTLEKLWLDETLVDDSCVDELKSLVGLKKLSVKGTKLTADGIKKLEESLTDCKVES